MTRKPTYEELEQRVKELDKQAAEHKRTEEALRESEENYKLLFENTGSAITFFDPEGKVILMNKAALDRLGWETEDLAGKFIYDILPKEIADFHIRRFSKIIKEQKGAEFEDYFEIPTGKYWFSSNIQPVKDKVGNIKGVQAISDDITERKQAEEEASYERDLMQTLLNNIPDYIYFKDRDRRFVRASNLFCDTFWCSMDEIIGKKDEDLFPEEIAKETASDERQVIETGIPLINKEEGGKSIGGGEHWVLTTKLPWRDKEGNIIGLFGISREITRRKQAEEALRESEEKYRNLFEDSKDPVVISTREGKLVDVNQAYLDLYGLTREEIADLNAHQLWANPDDRSRWVQELEQKGFVRDFEARHLKKDGTKIECLLTSTVRWAHDGSVVAYQGIVRDVTEKRKLQAQLQRAQKMEAIETLAGGVAHDLNNILAGLVSYPDLLLLEIPEDNPLRNPILTMQKSGEKAATIVEDLLTLARRGVAVKEVMNLNDIISEYLKSPEHERLKSFHAGVHVRTDLEGDLLNILGAPAHQSKTIMNLVSNAAEAMPEGGEISISTENQYIDRPIRGYDDLEEGDYVVLRVSDTGVGISKKDRERIFEPFYTKKVMGRSGTGLGMTVVWGTLKDHKGYIDIQSTKGKGTTLTLYFPVTRKELPKDKSLLSIEDYMGKGESILVIDDVKEQREIASKILKKLGYSVTTVSSGEEAVDYMKDNSADLLVLDMIMDPGIDGLDTYKRILEFHPGQKAIIASGFSETERVKEAQRLGAGAYVKKPFLLGKIGVAVRDELDK